MTNYVCPRCKREATGRPGGAMCVQCGQPMNVGNQVIQTHLTYADARAYIEDYYMNKYVDQDMKQVINWTNRIMMQGDDKIEKFLDDIFPGSKHSIVHTTTPSDGLCDGGAPYTDDEMEIIRNNEKGIGYSTFVVPNKTRRELVDKLKPFMPYHQIRTVMELMKGEESKYFYDKMLELIKVWDEMPLPYKTEGQGDQAIIRMHYFGGAMDWWILEKDSEPQQLQAFGYVDLGMGMDVGYIDIETLKENIRVELDFHWKPITVGELKRSKRLGYSGTYQDWLATGDKIVVVDNEFNRKNYKNIIGKVYDAKKPPAHANVADFFDKLKITDLWGLGKTLVYKGRKYRVGRMSYGDFFLEPIEHPQGEQFGHHKETLWLEKSPGGFIVLTNEVRRNGIGFGTNRRSSPSGFIKEMPKPQTKECPQCGGTMDWRTSSFCYICSRCGTHGTFDLPHYSVVVDMGKPYEEGAKNFEEVKRKLKEIYEMYVKGQENPYVDVWVHDNKTGKDITESQAVKEAIAKIIGE